MHSTVAKVKEGTAESGHTSNPFRVKGSYLSTLDRPVSQTGPQFKSQTLNP